MNQMMEGGLLTEPNGSGTWQTGYSSVVIAALDSQAHNLYLAARLSEII
jgi:hypothetical protein